MNQDPLAPSLPRNFANDIFASPATGGDGPKSGIALTLSGGGYRAMLFHLGFLWRMHDAGILANADRIVSVSGGSIAAAALAVQWEELKKRPDAFGKLVAAPVLELSRHGIDIEGWLWGRIPRLSGEWVRGAYDKYILKFAKMADLPPQPRFVFLATSMHSGKMVRINREHIGDWTMGHWDIGDVSVAQAVAASSAFPPVLSPCVISLRGRAFHWWKDRKTGEPQPPRLPPPEDKLFLADGGVYDNLGIEAVWKRFDTIYVSDAGAAFAFQPKGSYLMSKQALRVTGIMQDQIGLLRFRQINDAFKSKSSDPRHRKGFMVASDYLITPPPPESPPFDRDYALQLAATKTGLSALEQNHARALVNWGYVATDHRIRAAGIDMGRCVVPY
jgi:NTE family protein